MKTLQLTDEDYEALDEVLGSAIANATDLTQIAMSAAHRDKARMDLDKAQRLYDLIKPMEYQDEDFQAE